MLTVGVIADLTGSYSAQGDPSIVRGMNDWVRVTDSKGGLAGHQVKLSVCDTTSTLTGTATCAHKLGSVAGDVIAMNPPAEVEAATKILAQAKKVVFSQTPLEDPPHGSNLFQLTQPIIVPLTFVMRQAARASVHRVGLIVTDDASGLGISKGIDAAARPFGIDVVSETIPATATSATVQVEKLQSQHVDMIFDGGVGTAGVGILRSIKDLGLTQLPVVVESGNVVPEFLGAATGSIPGQIYGAPPSSFVIPSLLTGTAARSMRAFMADYKHVAGHALNTATDSPWGVALVAWVANLLVALGPNPTPSQAVHHLDGGALNGLVPLHFPATGAQTAVQPLALAEAQSGSGTWTPCVSGGPLKC